jgi:hypothetical protein
MMNTAEATAKRVGQGLTRKVSVTSYILRGVSDRALKTPIRSVPERRPPSPHHSPLTSREIDGPRRTGNDQEKAGSAGRRPGASMFVASVLELYPIFTDFR